MDVNRHDDEGGELGFEQRMHRLVAELVDELVSALMNARIWFADHPRVRLSLEALPERSRALGEAVGRHTFRIGSLGDFLVFDGRPLIGSSIGASRLVTALAAVGSGGIEIDTRASSEDWKALLAQLTERPLPDLVTASARMQAAGCMRLHLMPPSQASELVGDAYVGSPDPLAGGADTIGIDEGGEAIASPVKLCRRAMEMLQDITVTVCQGGRIDFASVQAEAEAMLRSLAAAPGPAIGLASRQDYDAFTLGHSLRVAVLSMSFARAIGMPSESVIRVGSAGLLHDVGKTAVPFEILHSRRALSPEEREVMNRHPETGAEILLDHDDSDPMAICTAFGHHRQCGDEGYPSTLHKHEQSRVTRIVKICDVFEALTAARPYKAAMPPSRAYRIMMSMRGHFDPWLLSRFIRHNGVWANGATVRLDTGESAFVLAQTDQLLAPRVLMLTDRDGQPHHAMERPVRDLSDPYAESKIVRLDSIAVEDVLGDDECLQLVGEISEWDPCGPPVAPSDQDGRDS